VIVAEVLPPAVVLTMKLAELAPPATVTLEGGLALLGLLLESVTTIPPNGAGPLKRTVPVEGEPATTVVGFKVRESNAGGLTASVAVLLAPL